MDRIDELREALCRRLDADEARLPPAAPSTLSAHSLRVATLAERLARATPGVAVDAAHLAGLLHDAGKFRGGTYHEGDVPEEVVSAEVARELLAAAGYPAATVDDVVDAIRELYRDGVSPGPLTRVVADADALDKLGASGVAAFFIKAGLRGQGLAPDLLARLGVELTYARCAREMVWSDAAREIAVRRAARTQAFFTELVGELREDGLADLIVDPVEVDGLEVVVVQPRRCHCGGELARSVCERPGVKCSEIRVTMVCRECGNELHMRMCRPRLVRR
jgi:putative nucleotidyltransferase with HDIG domain